MSITKSGYDDTERCEECKEPFNTDRNGKCINYTLFKSQLCWECFVEFRA